MSNICHKQNCLKQINPNIPDVFFGTPFQYDENWLGCWMCQQRPEEEKPKSQTVKFTRGK